MNLQENVTHNLNATTSWLADNAAMHEKFKVHEAIEKLSNESKYAFLKFRLEFLLEEIKETAKASGFELDFKLTQTRTMEQLSKTDDAEGVVDGIIDLIVVEITTLDLLRVNCDKAWKQVHDANMAKEVGVKEGRPNPLGLPDLIKPAGWTAPSHAGNVGLLSEIFG